MPKPSVAGRRHVFGQHGGASLGHATHQFQDTTLADRTEMTQNTTNAPNGALRFLLLTDAALVDQCEVDLYRASGPGGQKRNKTSSAVRLRHTPTGLVVTASEERSQHINRGRATQRLREAIALHVRRALDLPTYEPTTTLRAAIDKAGAIRIAAKNPDYHAVVSEVLDVVAACGSRVSDAAARLGVTTSHLVKFLEDDPKLWERVNQMRAAAGEKPLR